MRTIASRRSIGSVFRRKGGEGRLTMFYENLPAFEQRSLENKVRFSEGEKPVIAYFESEGSWCLLTNYRLVWQDLVSQHEVGIMELRRVTHDSGSFEVAPVSRTSATARSTVVLFGRLPWDSST